MALVPSTSIGGASGAITQVYDNVAGASIASWDVTGIAATYTHLQLVIVARSDAVANTDSVFVRFNNDSAGNYDRQTLQANIAAATAAESFAQSGALLGNCSAANAGANLPGIIETLLPNYASTVFDKAVLARSGVKAGTTTGLLIEHQLTAFWRSNVAINRITVFPATGPNFITGSRLTIYGLT